MSEYRNPFNSNDPDRFSIWEMLVERDIKAFIGQNWPMVEDDFIAEGFMGIDGRNLSNPDSWRLNFPSLSSYKQYWLNQAEEFNKSEFTSDPETSLLEATTLRDIDIVDNSALVRKKFDGVLAKKSGELVRLNWQTLYRCRKIDNVWKIAGFTGFLPHPLGANDSIQPAKKQPDNASQHASAGPYSPVLQIQPGQIIVISGQAALNQEGEVVGHTIEEQTKLTLENCRKQLESAGSSLNDAFKVNVYLTDLGIWPRFNEVYKRYFREPLPVRTAVQTGLLSSLLVEIEIWAVKK